MSTLTLSTIFKLFVIYGKEDWPIVHFAFSEKTLNLESWVYFTMEHINAIGIGCCLVINDNTPRWLLLSYIWILIADLVHYLLFFRDDGIGFNLFKVVIYGGCILYNEYKQ